MNSLQLRRHSDGETNRYQRLPAILTALGLTLAFVGGCGSNRGSAPSRPLPIFAPAVTLGPRIGPDEPEGAVRDVIYANQVFPPATTNIHGVIILSNTASISDQTAVCNGYAAVMPFVPGADPNKYKRTSGAAVVMNWCLTIIRLWHRQLRHYLPDMVLMFQQQVTLLCSW